MRILGMDYGEKWIGMAISDPLGITAQGLPTIERTDIERDREKILLVIREKNVAEIVVGLPKHMNNTLGQEARDVLAFIELL